MLARESYFTYILSFSFKPVWQKKNTFEIFHLKFYFPLFASDGKMNERLCPDGMVFNDYDSDVEKCDLPYNIDCSKRSKLREYFEF